MASTIKAVVFDLRGVLLEWDRHRVDTLTESQFPIIMNSFSWQRIDTGGISAEEAYKVRSLNLCIYSSAPLLLTSVYHQDFGNILGVDPAIIKSSLEQAHRSLTINEPLVRAIYDLKASNPELRFYIVANIWKVSLNL
jgi:FMN phosphatase YigB (HAD superfamily)